jgi:hypothetical protein
VRASPEPNEDDCWEALKLEALRKGNGLTYFFALTKYIGVMAPLRIGFVRKLTRPPF